MNITNYKSQNHIIVVSCLKKHIMLYFYIASVKIKIKTWFYTNSNNFYKLKIIISINNHHRNSTYKPISIMYLLFSV